MPQRALLLVDHGSRLAEANAVLEEAAGLLKRQRPDLIVAYAHMELAEPTLAQACAQCVQAGATEVVVHPYMLSPGRHAARDIPRLVSESAKLFPAVRFRVTPPLGLHPKIMEVVLERAGL